MRNKGIGVVHLGFLEAAAELEGMWDCLVL